MERERDNLNSDIAREVLEKRILLADASGRLLTCEEKERTGDRAPLSEVEILPVRNMRILRRSGNGKKEIPNEGGSPCNLRCKLPSGI